MSYEAIAEAVQLDSNVLKRVVQHAIANGIFCEPEPGYIRHTAMSRMLNQDPEAMDAVGFLLNDCRPATEQVVHALTKYPSLNKPNETGFNLANNSEDLFYVELAKKPERARTFGGGMRWMTRGPVYDIQRLIDGYDWKAIDTTDTTIVDIGGGHGGVSRALANATSNIQFIVQDLPGTVEEGQRILPSHLKDRISFQAHDFFNPQPVQGASIYFFRSILHNWPDGYVEQILRNQIPALVDGSRILVYEFVQQTTADTTLRAKHCR